MHHLRHLPPIMCLGVAMSCSAGASGIRTSGALGASWPCAASSSADKVSQLSVNDDVKVKIVPCERCLIVISGLVLTHGIRSRRLRVVPSRLVLNRSNLWLFQ